MVEGTRKSVHGNVGETVEVGNEGSASLPVIPGYAPHAFGDVEGERRFWAESWRRCGLD